MIGDVQIKNHIRGGALADTIKEDEFDPKNRDSYLKELPMTIDAMKESNQKIIQPILMLG